VHVLVFYPLLTTPRYLVVFDYTYPYIILCTQRGCYNLRQQDASLAVLCLLTTTSMLYMFRTPFASIIRAL